MSGKSVHDIAQREWQSRLESADQVRKKLRSGWRNDPTILNQYFQACYTNWKLYKGPRTVEQVLKLQSVYKQAVYGDNTDIPPVNLHSAAGKKWMSWDALRGTTQETAKRRFITLLAQIDPVLIDVMPAEKPPIGFPLDRRGIPICAKCNTLVGCQRPLLDENKMNLKQQLYEHEELHQPVRFKLWVQNALVNQRCVWGLHKPISKPEAKPFMDWFDRDENRGFYPYDSSTIIEIVKEVVQYNHEVALEMMQQKEDVDPHQYNDQAVKALKLKDILEQLSGEPFDFEVECARDNDQCNRRRQAEGGKNHRHSVQIDPPTHASKDTMEEAVELRLQCQRLGISPATGVVKDIAERCEIYRQRIAAHFEALRKAREAKERNMTRDVVHTLEKNLVGKLAREMLRKQCWEACHVNATDLVLNLVKRGCNPNEESPRGLTPLLCLVLNGSIVENVEALIKFNVNVDVTNCNGLNALMLACRLKDSKMIHTLMRAGASVFHQADHRGFERSALHWCVVHGSEEAVKIMADYLKEAVGESTRLSKFLNLVDAEGDSALMLAAKIRNGLMCQVLLTLGADPHIRNQQGRNADYLARGNNFPEIADWLDRKVSAGVSKLETYSDIQFEKNTKFAQIKLRELIHEFGYNYLMLMQGRVSQHPLGCPFLAHSMVKERGEKAVKEQTEFVDNHHFFIHHRDRDEFLARRRNRPDFNPRKVTSEEEEKLSSVHRLMEEMVQVVRQGMANPNAEAEEKPLSWTPLMCAAALNDVRSAKLLMREGANPNHPNRSGTTAVMLAAQLQNLEVLVEFLHRKGDLDSVDNEGYRSLAYASSLPLPTIMKSDPVTMILNTGDQSGVLSDGPKFLESAELIKIALKSGVEPLRDLVKERNEAASPAKVAHHAKLMQLLETHGLSRVETERNVHDQIKSSAWRLQGSVTPLEDDFDPSIDPKTRSWIKQSESISRVASLDSEVDEYELAAAERYQELKRQEEKEKEEEERQRLSELRCPICTLKVPCAHFYKAEVLEQFLEKQLQKQMEEEEEEKKKRVLAIKGKNKRNSTDQTKENIGSTDETGAKGEKTEDSVEPEEKPKYRVKKKLKVKNKRQEILKETDLNDRATDRSVKLIDEFRERMFDVEKETAEAFKQARIQEQNNPTPTDTEGALNSFPPKNSSKQVSTPFVVDAAPPIYLPPRSPMKSALKRPSQSSPAVSNSNIPLLLEDLKDSSGRGTPTTGRRIRFDAVDQVKEVLPVALIQRNWPDEEHQRTLSREGNAMEESSKDEAPSGKLGFQVMQTGTATGAAASILGPNPVPLPTRKIFMFTRDSLGGPSAAEDDDSSSGDEMVRKRPPVAIGPSYERKADVARSSKIKLSGWVFVGLAALRSCVCPVEQVVLTQEKWAIILEHMREKFLEKILPKMLLEPLLDVATWKSNAPRCVVCAVGFVRCADSVRLFRKYPDKYLEQQWASRTAPRGEEEESSGRVGTNREVFKDEYMCVTCLLRRELFEKVWTMLPRRLRGCKSEVKWPFLLDPGTEDTDASNRFSLLHSSGNTEVPVSPPNTHNNTVALQDEDSQESSPPPILTTEGQEEIAALVPFSPGMDPSTGFGAFHSPVRSKTLQILDAEEAQEKAALGPTDIISPLLGRRLASRRSEGRPTSSQVKFSDTFGEVGAENLYHSADTAVGLSRQNSHLIPLERQDSTSSSSGKGPSGQEDEEMSQLSASEMSNALSTGHLSLFSSSSAVSKTPDKTPKELSLLSFLIFKGHLEEAERTVRIALGKQSIDEGEGLLKLLRLLNLQAEMYKTIGLWSLAVGIYLDCADLTTALLGLRDSLSLSSLHLVKLSFRKMQLPHLAKHYHESLCAAIEEGSLKKMRKELLGLVKDRERDNLKRYLYANEIYSERLKKHANAKSTLGKKLDAVVGMRGFYLLLTAQDGFFYTARLCFFSYCKNLTKTLSVKVKTSIEDIGKEKIIDISPLTIGEYTDYVELSFRLRICDDKDVLRHLTHHLIQKQLPKRKIETSQLVSLFYKTVNHKTIKQATDYLKHGSPFNIELFDDLLEIVLLRLFPLFRLFLLREPAGNILRQYKPEIMEEIRFTGAVIIQCCWRKMRARGVCWERKKEYDIAIAEKMKKQPKLVKTGIELEMEKYL